MFEADDLREARRVAIQIVDDADAGADMLLHTAPALAEIRHPSLPAIYGMGIHEGRTFLVMEHVCGVTLEEHLEQLRGAPLPIDESLAILVPLADALAALHTAGFAHRDLTPRNVMLSAGRVVLLDFGVDRSERPRGMPCYAAPEQITDTVSPARAHLVDVYAFGAIAFELLAGHAPFEAPTLVQVLEHHLETPPPDLGTERPDAPRPLAEIVLACMAKDPAWRPDDLGEIAARLRTMRPRTAKGSGRLRAASLVAPVAAPREVLVVDDDPDQRDVLALSLDARGFRVRVAVDGRDALDLLRLTGFRPAAIVLDLEMPNLDGLQFLAIQAADAEIQRIPVIVVSGVASAAVATFSQVHAALQKPTSVPTLVEHLDQACRARTGS